MMDQRLSKAATSLVETPAGESGPSVAIARQWLQQVILPRRIYSERAGAFRLVEMGEDPAGSSLFPVCGTSLADLSAFGIGIGLYFRMLLQLALLMFVLAAVSTPTVIYFVSSEYSGEMSDRELDLRIWGTAACTRQELVSADNSSSHSGSGGNATEMRNDCPLKMAQLHIDFVVLAILCLYCLIAGVTQNRTKAYLDALEQTAADYSIVVKDPNANAWNPDEWEMYFRQFGPVKFVTVAVHNHRLLSALAHKRYMEDMLRMESPDHAVIKQAMQQAVDGNLPGAYTSRSLLLKIQQKFGMHRNLPYWVGELHKQRKHIEALVKHEAYRVWSVFVMFETEEGQRRCLKDTRVGLCSTVLDWKHSQFPRELRFRGTNILQIEQAVEPSSVQWKNVGVAWRWRFMQQVVTVTVVVGMMVGVYFLALELKNSVVGGKDEDEDKRRRNLYILAYTLSFTDYLGCKVLSYLDLLEQHQTKEREQLSTLNKLLLFRCFNSALVLYFLMDFTDVLSQENLLLIQAMLIANLVTIPVLQLLNPYGRFMRWFYGPKAKTQRKLNQYYSGAYWQLAERYTQITKSVGIALFYKALLPTGLVITSVSLLVNYWVDKYCLLRKWKVPPKYDGLLARASGYHLLVMAMASLVMMGHWYDGWPFDGPTMDAIEETRSESKSTIHSSILYTLRLIFPFPRTYSTDEQTDLMKVLTAVIVIIILATVTFVILKTIYRTWLRYVVGSRYGLRAMMSEIPASRVKNLNGYIPSYESWYSDFPFLCVALDGFDHQFINWSGDHGSYCLVDDVLNDPVLAPLLKDRPIEQLFGACKQYPVGDGEEVRPSDVSLNEDEEHFRKCTSSVV